MASVVDHYGTLWVGTMSAGLARLEPGSQTFHTYQTDPADQQSLPANGVMSLFEDTHGNLWVGDLRGRPGAFRSRPATASGATRRQRPKRAFRVTARRRWPKTKPASCGWVPTGGGLNLLDPDTGKVVRFAHERDDTGTLSANTVYAVHVDARGSVWVGTRGGGLDHVIRLGAPP